MKAGAAETRRGRSPTRKDFRKQYSEGQPLKEGEKRISQLKSRDVVPAYTDIFTGNG